MNTVIAAAIAAILTVGPANSTLAYSFAPSDTKFHINGTVTISGPQGSVVCQVRGGGKNTVRANTQIGTLVFYQPCITTPYFIVAIGLPWPVKATSATTATISNLSFTGQGGGFGPCGPGNVHVNVSADGAWHINAKMLPGGCMIKGDLQTSPPLTIVP